jgi:predicted membrane-bound dolichyl-phosphate-mannose-protein mannosyltransferase
MSNWVVNREECKLYNDQMMELFCVLGIYLLSCHSSPLLSSFSFTVAMSLKAGAILYLPGLLGTIQYRYGLRRLVAAILIIVGWQVAVAAPFLKQFGGETDVKTYLQMSKLMGGDGRGS